MSGGVNTIVHALGDLLPGETQASHVLIKSMHIRPDENTVEMQQTVIVVQTIGQKVVSQEEKLLHEHMTCIHKKNCIAPLSHDPLILRLPSRSPHREGSSGGTKGVKQIVS